jgi:hypothetical protein
VYGGCDVRAGHSAFTVNHSLSPVFARLGLKFLFPPLERGWLHVQSARYGHKVSERDVRHLSKDSGLSVTEGIRC